MFIAYIEIFPFTKYVANFSLFKLTLYKKWENIAKRLKVDRKPLACEDVF